MDEKQEYAALLANRADLYRVLARLYKIEVDPPLLEQLTALKFPIDAGDPDLQDGFRLLGGYLQQSGAHGGDPVTDLAVDFARTFLGAGVVEGVVAFPYESVYTSPARLIMQDARDKVLAAYNAKGIGKTMDVPEDHIGLELEFMAVLCENARRALETDDWAAVSASLSEQKEFLSRHLLNWVPAFCRDIHACVATDFYRGLAKMTTGYLRMEEDIIDDLLAEAMTEAA